MGKIKNTNIMILLRKFQTQKQCLLKVATFKRTNFFCIKKDTEQDKVLKEKRTREEKESITNVKIAQKYIRDNVQKFDWVTFIIGFYIPKAVRDDFYTIHWLNKELFKISNATKELS